jgi:diguanylate cyclase (GGDEF)-like protein/PAS domain S-box-containing protein
VPPKASPPPDAFTTEATLRALQDISVATNAAHDPATVAELAVARAKTLTGADGAVVFAYDAPTRLLLPLHETESAIEEPPCRPGQGAIGMAFKSGAPVVVDDYRTWKHALPESQVRGMVSALAVPLLSDDRPIGALGVWTYAPRDFTERETQLLTLFAAQLAPALEGARLTEEAQAKARMFQALHEVAVASSGVFDTETLGRLVVERAVTLLGLEGAGLWWWDGDEKLLNPVAWQDAREGWTIGPYKSGEGAVGSAFAGRHEMVIEDYQGWTGAASAAKHAGVKATLAVPLLAGDRAMGAMSVWTYESRRFRREDSQLLALFAAQVAPALERTRLAAERQHQADVLRALNDVAAAASGLLEPRALAALTVDRARDIVKADSAALMWGDRARGLLIKLADNDPDDLAPTVIPHDNGVVGMVYGSGKPHSVGDYANWKHAFPPAVEKGIGSVAAVPLLVADQPVGGMVLRSRQASFFDDDKLELASLLAAQVAPALQAAQLHADLLGSEQRFRSLFETIACGVLVQGAKGEVLDANRAAEEILGVGLAEMRGHSSAELWEVEEEGYGKQRPALIALATKRPVRNYTFKIRRRDGDVRWLQADSIPVLDQEGQASQVVSSIIDVTERNRAEDALRESEERFRAVYDQAGIGIARLSLEGKIEDANPALAQMLGYTAEELVGHDVQDFVHADDFRTEAWPDIVSGHRRSVQAEVRCNRKDKSVMWGQTTLTGVRGRDGKITFLIGMIEDVTDRKAQEAAIAHQAMHDALTDLPNRALLADRLHQAIRVAKRERHHLALLMMDLDHFKEVNDTFGHQAGDVLLRDVASRLRGELRGSDTVARLGGDEFAILLGRVETSTAASHTARKLLHALDAPFVVEGETVDIGGSIGISMYPEHGGDADLLMRHADVAMYVAKRAGTGYSLYAADADRHSPSRLALISELRHAIDRDELVLHYQPKVEVKSGKVIGAEALVRWAHPRLGLVTPDQFIDLAEHTGLIRPLGLWVIENAVKQCREWRQRDIDLTISINLSMRNLHDPQLPQVVHAALRRHKVKPAWIVFEITEHTLLADPENAMRIVTRLAEMGVKLSIDDFGTGYSSLSYLRRLPVGEIKIDRSFVLGMAAEENAAVIVHSAIDLGHNLGLQVVAEGVEDKRTLAMVLEGGVDVIQGNLLAAARPADELEKVVGTLNLDEFRSA